MKKAKLLAPRNMAREILSESDAERMLQSGSWVIASIPKKRTAGARNQANFFRRRLDAGYRKLQVLLPNHVFNSLQAKRRDGETLASLLERLLFESDSNSDKKPKLSAHD